MPEVSDAVAVGEAPYSESQDFVPNPTDVVGTLDTSATAGAAHGRIESVTPVFDIAKRENALVAARAVDPDDDSVSISAVTLPGGEMNREEAINLIKEKASASKPVVLGGPNEFQEQAAEDTSADDDDDDDVEQKQAAAPAAPAASVAAAPAGQSPADKAAKAKAEAAAAKA